MVETGFYCSVMFVKKRLDSAFQFSTGECPPELAKTQSKSKVLLLKFQSDTLPMNPCIMVSVDFDNGKVAVFTSPISIFLLLLSINTDNVFFFLIQQCHFQNIHLITHRYHTQGKFSVTTSCVGDMLPVLIESKGPW